MNTMSKVMTSTNFMQFIPEGKNNEIKTSKQRDFKFNHLSPSMTYVMGMCAHVLLRCSFFFGGGGGYETTSLLRTSD